MSLFYCHFHNTLDCFLDIFTYFYSIMNIFNDIDLLMWEFFVIIIFVKVHLHVLPVLKCDFHWVLREKVLVQSELRHIFFHDTFKANG